jgi:putative transposase
MRTSLVTDALRMAITHGRARPGAVFHSDRGCQYTSAEFSLVLQEKPDPNQRRTDRSVLGL